MAAGRTRAGLGEVDELLMSGVGAPGEGPEEMSRAASAAVAAAGGQGKARRRPGDGAGPRRAGDGPAARAEWTF